MVYGMQSSPLTHCCKALLRHLDEELCTKARDMQYLSHEEYVKITSPDERQDIEQFNTQAINPRNQENTAYSHLAENLLKTIEQLWERHQKLNVSAK